MIDNLIRPRIVSGRADVPALPVFLGIVGGIASFGLRCVFLGPLILVSAIEIARSLAGEPIGDGDRRTAVDQDGDGELEHQSPLPPRTEAEHRPPGLR